MPQIELLKSRIPELLGAERCRFDEPMSAHTTFRTGGPAFCLAYPATAEKLKALVGLCREADVPCMVIGKGSNLLVSDAGYPGVMISLEKLEEMLIVEGTHIRASAGTSLAAIARAAMNAGLTGFEFASGIPGTLGGAMMMNAGAYGGEMSQVAVSARVLTPEGEIVTVPAREMRLGYRSSRFEESGEIVLSAELALTSGDPEEIRKTMSTLAEQRRTKQPLEYPSAGSTFKRPTGFYAGKLIQDAGLRGYSVGGAQVSEKHCGFVINRGGATASEIYQLCRDVSRIVGEQSGVKLELEVKLIGEF